MKKILLFLFIGITLTATAQDIKIFKGGTGATGAQGVTGATGPTGATGSAGSIEVSDSAWSLTGNAGTNPTDNFIGTTDSLGFRIQGQSTTPCDSCVSNAGVHIIGSSVVNTGIFSDGFGVDGVGNRVKGVSNTNIGVLISGDGANNSDIVLAPANGLIKLINIGEADGYILTSDVDGFATWQSSGGLSLWADSSGNTYSTSSGNVGIGTATPAYKLDVLGFIHGLSSIGGNELTVNDGGWNINLTSGSQFNVSDNSGHSMVFDGAGTGQFIITGVLTYADGNQGVGKVLTSDAIGNATWQEIGHPFETYGDTTVAVSGLTTTIVIPHGLGAVPTAAFVQFPNSIGDVAFSEAGWVWDASNITITLGAATLLSSVDIIWNAKQ